MEQVAMTFDEEARERCKAKVNKQSLPTKLFPFYVVYALPWALDYPYVIGFECGFAAMAMESEFKEKGYDAGTTLSYPYEHMNPEVKNERKRDSGNKTPRTPVHGQPGGSQEGVLQPVKEVAP